MTGKKTTAAPQSVEADGAGRDTARRLKAALESMQSKGEKITISGVARAANVTPALIHNTYPDLAEKIRAVMGKSTRSKRDAMAEEVKRTQRSARESRAELDALRQDFAKLASLNQALVHENQMLRAASMSNVASIRASSTGEIGRNC